MRAKIYQPAPNAMQSGRAKDEWLLEYGNSAPKRVDPLMGWNGSSDTLSQLKMRFPSKEAAINFVEAKGIDYQLEESKGRKRKPNIRAQGYAENFATNRRTPWTH